MKKLIGIVMTSLVLCLPALSFACDYPERPTLPNGNTASKDDMISAQAAVKEFLGAVDEYLVCIEQEEKDAVADIPDLDESEVKRRDELLTKRFDAANEEKFRVGEEWNQQVRAYNAQKPESGSE